jgi:hypothetical protein
MAERRPSAGSSALNDVSQQELGTKYSMQGRTQVAPRVQTMQNARPTVRSALSNLMRDAVDATGLEGGYRQGLLNAAGGVETAVDFLPVVGDVLGVEDASRAYGQGDMVGAGINLMGVVPVVGDVAAKSAKSARSALRNVISAGHASPHRFEQFSMDKIGTGEGAQVYGHGLYFAENPTVVDEYFKQFNSPVLRFKEKNVDTPYTAELRDRFKDVYEGLIDDDLTQQWKLNVLDAASDAGLNTDEVADKLDVLIKNVFAGSETVRDFSFMKWDKLGIDPNEVYDLANNQLSLDNVLGGISQAKTMDDLQYVVESYSPDEMRLYKNLVEPELAEIRDSASRYDVNLNVESEDLLDWDAPLSEQSEKVQNALGRNDKWTTGASFYHLKSGAIDDQLTEKSGELYDFIQSHPKFNAEERNFSSGEVISSWLNSKGVSGVKYYDGFSRNAKEGTRNYVMFDDSLIDTKRVNDQLTPSWMDQGARMQRAQDLGFDTERTAYRGLSGEYDPNKAGNYQMFTSSPEDAGEYGSNVVSSYLRKGNNLVVDGGRNNFNSIPVSQLPDNVRANLHSSVGSVARTDDIAFAAQAAGYDSVSINNVFDKAWGEIPSKPPSASNAPMSQEMMDFLDEVSASEEYKAYQMLNNTPDVALPPEIPRNNDPTTIDIIFDPKNIRSIEAEFDPTKADSADLLSNRQSERQMSALRGIA